MTESMQSVLSRFIPTYRQYHRLTPEQSKVCYHLGQCRTKALGGQRVGCDQCGFEQHRYHSCRNRHCPKCQHHATQQWSTRQLHDVLPLSYYHVVFTLPHELNPWVQCHRETIYRCLFQSVWKTLKTFGADKKRLDGELGMTAILHTWGQSLCQHVHLHCLIPGGALSHDQQQWHAAKSNYLFPVRALSRHFRGAMVSALRAAWQAGELSRLDETQVDECLQQRMQHDWVVYSKAYLKQADTIVRYLGRYTHKIAISDSRIVEVKNDQVVFRCKDYQQGNDKLMQLEGEEFIRRFLLHVLPSGFMRIRHFGFLSNRNRQKKLRIIRTCLQAPVPSSQVGSAQDELSRFAISSRCPCPKCHKGQLKVLGEIPPTPLHGR